MIKELNEKYAEQHPGKKLIDGAGMQGHYNINTNPANVRLSMERFISLGVEVGITELDIQAGADHQLSEQEAEAQGYLYAQLFDLYKEHAEHITRVTFWGMDDGSSWRSATNPTLFDSHLQTKPAYYGVLDPDGIMATHEPEIVDALYSRASYATPVIDGVVGEIWNESSAMNIER